MSNSIPFPIVRWAPGKLMEAIEVAPMVHERWPATNLNAARCEVSVNHRNPGGVRRRRLIFALPTITSNGFSLLEISRVIGTPDHRFRVVDAAGEQRNISVRFGIQLVGQVDRRRRAHLWIGSRFWALCAEARLEAYLVKAGEYPPDGQLVVDELSEDEMLLGAYWRDNSQ